MITSEILNTLIALKQPPTPAAIKLEASAISLIGQKIINHISNPDMFIKQISSLKVFSYFKYH
jgi:hypothetical protein